MRPPKTRTPGSGNKSQSGTLHAFFSKASSEKKQRAPSLALKPLKSSASGNGLSAKAKGKQRANYVPPPDAEIIVIESDEEVVTHVSRGASNGKRRAEDASSDVEVVEILGTRCAGSNKKIKKEDDDRADSINLIQPGPSIVRASSSSSLKASSSESILSFGKPSQLLLSSKSTEPPSLPAAPHTVDPPSSSSWGVPLLLQPTRSLSNADTSTTLSSRNSPIPEVTPQLVTDDIIEIDDEWGMGDDELAPVPDDAGQNDSQLGDDDEAQDVIDLDSDSEVESCPICGKLLKSLQALEIQDHMNKCADASTSPSKLDRNPSSCSNSSATHSPSKTSAFSVLMSSHQENEAWKEASLAEDRNFRPTKGNGGRRKAPFYKVMTGMPIAVDAFRYGAIPEVTAYFLTHAHSDHYTNLSSKWKAGPIYCSGPGSSLFLFEGPQTIDAGDSSYKSPAAPQHVLHPSVKGKRLDCIYLDTTYLNPKYTFPSQAQVISACADLAKKVVSGESVAAAIRANGNTKTMDDWFTIIPKSEDKGSVKIQRTLVVVGTYSIGKERVVKAVAKALQTKVYCDSRKAAILRCQADPELHAMLTKDPFEAGVHLVPLGVISSDRIKEYTERWKGHWSRTLAFRPTGWTYTPAAGTDTAPPVASIVSHLPHKEFTCTNLRPMRNSTATHQLFGVPYSEHSSFFELTCFTLSLDWARIVATVNVGSESSRGKIATWVARWEAEKKKRSPGVVPYRTLDYW
ncbi:hypothetical protein EVG20_g712 [Dentipellis fragilis]|uniref:DNA repair metallo-beta-lactamase domain-containing protein n=1 Tax=Dentipellis fragilis TaxID=205917 RepID=A0A4Y9ZDP7_9AGAM|nr:hypothetical protein EVG20_g712 [Dentipellis fragilis]